jgi:signal recognition particle GTPase
MAGLSQSAGAGVMLVAGDPHRPAAAEQLQGLGARLGVPVEWQSDISSQDLARKSKEKQGWAASG